MASSNITWNQRVKLSAADPTLWLQHARTLKQAGVDLWRSGCEHDQNPESTPDTTLLVKYETEGFVAPETGGMTRDVSLMILGFALENLVKGILILRDPSRISPEGLKKWPSTGHDLLALYTLAEIQISDQVRDLLNSTSTLIEWKGRYPLPLVWEKVGIEEPLLGYIALRTSDPKMDYDMLLNIYESTKKTLIDLMNSIPPLPDDHDFGPAKSSTD